MIFSMFIIGIIYVQITSYQIYDVCRCGRGTLITVPKLSGRLGPFPLGTFHTFVLSE